MYSCHIFLSGRIRYTTAVFFLQFGAWEDVLVAAWFSPTHLLTRTNLSIQHTLFFFLLCFCFQPLLLTARGLTLPELISSEVQKNSCCLDLVVWNCLKMVSDVFDEQKQLSTCQFPSSED